MVDILQEIVLLNLIEAIMTVYIVIDFRKYGKLQVLFALLCSLFVIYVYPIMIPIPIPFLPQVLMVLVNAYVLSKIFTLDFKFCMKRIFALFLYIMLAIEMPIYAVYKYILHLDILNITNVFDLFKMGIPVRIIEIISLPYFKRSNIVDLNFKVFKHIGQIYKRGVFNAKSMVLRSNKKI